MAIQPIYRDLWLASKIGMNETQVLIAWKMWGVWEITMLQSVHPCVKLVCLAEVNTSIMSSSSESWAANWSPQMKQALRPVPPKIKPGMSAEMHSWDVFHLPGPVFSLEGLRRDGSKVNIALDDGKLKELASIHAAYEDLGSKTCKRQHIFVARYTLYAPNTPWDGVEMHPFNPWKSGPPSARSR